jgi:hypothetical protein
MKIDLFKVTIKKWGLSPLYKLRETVRNQLLKSVGRESVQLTKRIIDNNLTRSHKYSVGRRTGRIAAGTHPYGPMWMGDTVFGGTVIGEGVPHANIHIGPEDKETVLKPNTKRAMTIPQAAAMNSRRVRRPEYPVGGLRGIPGLFAKGGMIWKRRGQKGRIPLFLLWSKPIRLRTRVRTDAIAAANESTVQRGIENDINTMVTKI